MAKHVVNLTINSCILKQLTEILLGGHENMIQQTLFAVIRYSGAGEVIPGTISSSINFTEYLENLDIDHDRSGRMMTGK